MRGRLPDFLNQDYGLTVSALATLGAPLDDAWLDALVREAGQKV